MKTKNEKTAPKKTAPKTEKPKRVPSFVLIEKCPSEEITGKKRARIPADFEIIPLISKNPSNPTKNRFSMVELWLSPKKPISVEEYRKAGGIMFDLLVAVKQGQAKVAPASAPKKSPKG